MWQLLGRGETWGTRKLCCPEWNSPVCTTVVCSVALCHSQQLSPVTGTWPNSVCGLHRMSFTYSEAMPKQEEHKQELSPPFFLAAERKSPSWILSGHWFSHGVPDFGICFKSCLPESTTRQNTDCCLGTASFKSEWCISLHQFHFAPETFLFVLTTCKFHLKLSLHFPGCIMTFSSLSMWSMSMQKMLHNVLIHLYMETSKLRVMQTDICSKMSNLFYFVSGFLFVCFVVGFCLWFFVLFFFCNWGPTA